jgi:hypothetical protein
MMPFHYLWTSYIRFAQMKQIQYCAAQKPIASATRLMNGSFDLQISKSKDRDRLPSSVYAPEHLEASSTMFIKNMDKK